MASNNQTLQQIEALTKSVEALQQMMKTLLETPAARRPQQQQQKPKSAFEMDDAELMRTYGPWRIDAEEFAAFKEECAPSKRNLAIAKLLAMNLKRVTTYYEGELYHEWREETPKEDVAKWWTEFNGQGIPTGL
jgi:hypothetical protein